MDFSYRIIPSKRKTLAIQITPGGEVLVRCPRQMPRKAVAEFVESKRDWIEKNLRKLPPAMAPLSSQELEELKARAKVIIPERVAHFAPLVGVSWGKITVRSQRSRWGSCSGKGNLNFNCLLMLVPDGVLDYVVVHELCHRKHLNHGSQFWAAVEAVLPDYKVRRQWLKEQGNALIARLPET